MTTHSASLHTSSCAERDKLKLKNKPLLKFVTNVYDFQSNEISELERQSFGLLPVVSELNLANNQIEALIDQTFLGLKQLTVLNLSSNSIATVTTSAFKGNVMIGC